MPIETSVPGIFFMERLTTDLNSLKIIGLNYSSFLLIQFLYLVLVNNLFISFRFSIICNMFLIYSLYFVPLSVILSSFSLLIIVYLYLISFLSSVCLISFQRTWLCLKLLTFVCIFFHFRNFNFYILFTSSHPL